MTRARLRALLALLALVLAAAAAAAAPAGAQAPRVSLNDLEDEVMCDVCNVPLNIAESPRATQQRNEIRELIARGMTKEQIKAELKRRYGPAILATPESSGFGLAAWLVPIAVVLGVLALLAAALPRWRRRRRVAAAAAAPEGPAISPADARRLEQDLARYDV